MIHVTHSLKETQDLAAKFLAGCEEGRRATVVGLYGELGAGKTSFTQGIARALGIQGHITSPTFVLEKIYKLKKGLPYDKLVHIDAYRLSDGQEMAALGWDEVVADRKNIVFIEWPERVADVLPKQMIKIYFEAGKKEDERKIKISC